jgi:hypothetical protein
MKNKKSANYILVKVLGGTLLAACLANSREEAKSIFECKFDFNLYGLNGLVVICVEEFEIY